MFWVQPSLSVIIWRTRIDWQSFLLTENAFAMVWIHLIDDWFGKCNQKITFLNKSTPVILNRFEKHVSQATFSRAFPLKNWSSHQYERVAALLVSLSITLTINYFIQKHRGITSHWHFCECTTIIIIYHKPPPPPLLLHVH